MGPIRQVVATRLKANRFLVRGPLDHSCVVVVSRLQSRIISIYGSITACFPFLPVIP